MMDNEPFSQTAFNRLVRSFANRGVDMAWMDWLPASLAAAEAPERWLTAFQALELSDQFALLELLRQPSAGPLADTLLVVLSRHATELEDAQVRQFVLDYAVGAREHTLELLHTLRNQKALLEEGVVRATERVSEGFDLAVEIARLETELARIREAEFNQDGRFARVHEIEQEILRIETQRHILDSYDEPARRAYLAGLEAEIGALATRKATLEKQISSLIGTRDTLSDETAALEDQESTAQQQLETLQERLGAARTAAEIVRRQYDEARKEELSLNEMRRATVENIARMEKEMAENRAWCETRRRDLERLHEQAAEAGLETLALKIREVYAMLPRDKADEGFSTTTRRQ